MVHNRYYADVATPVTMESGADLMLLKPAGTGHRLVRGGAGAVTGLSVSIDVVSGMPPPAAVKAGCGNGASQSRYVSVKNRQGNVTVVERAFRVGG
jgi:hypothetical protein